MKQFMKLVFVLSSIIGFYSSLSSRVLADDKPITSSLGNPKIKLIGELTLPSAIKRVVFEKDGNGSMRIGKILTEEGFYSVDEKLAIKSLLDLKKWKTEGKRWVFNEGISNDCNYAIASLLTQEPTDGEYYPDSQYIVNLRTEDKTQLMHGGWPAFSDNTIMFCSGLGVFSTSITDLKGNLLKSYTGREAVTQIVGHRFGFFGAGVARFFDQNGNIQKTYKVINQPEFRAIYDTGKVAVQYCVFDESGKPKESKIGIYDWKGDLQHEMTLPFDSNIDLGFSPDGRYVVVAARSGWVKLLDMEITKEVWSKDVEVFKYFYWHDPFPIMRDAKCFAFITLEPATKKFMVTIFSFAGDIVGYIEINKRPDMEEYRLEFIPDTSTLVFHSNKYINLYKIES